MEEFKNREAFDAYWNENYVPLTYEDVKEAYEDFVKSADKHIFIPDYEEAGAGMILWRICHRLHSLRFRTA